MSNTSILSLNTVGWRFSQLAHLIGQLAYRVRFLSRAAGSRPDPRYLRLRNLLPNSGPVPVGRAFNSADEIIAGHPDPRNRALGLDLFEGFAPDDAVFDHRREAGELWSNARLAAFLAGFAYARYDAPAVLELGCGPAHLFYYLRRYGVPDYVGIDGNPYFVRFNPLLQGFERHFLHLNLQQELRLADGQDPVAFDLVCSFEVLEHIREDRVDNFLRTVRNHMHPRSVFLCTASLQDNIDVHVLVRDRGWWLERFARFGLFSRPDEGELVRQMARRHPFNWTAEHSNLFALELRNGKESLS